MNYNDLDIDNWKNLEINVDSLWLLGERDKKGKHSNIYHGNFIPQIPNQIIRRFTKKNDIVLDVFMGSGTTLFESETLGRNFIGFDINGEIIEFVKSKMIDCDTIQYDIHNCDTTNTDEFEKNIDISLKKMNSQKVQLIIYHPPYLDIVKFTDRKEDLSHISNLKEFISKFKIVLDNSLKYLEKNRYFAIVIGDVYKNSEVVPLSFYILDNIKRNFSVKLKGIIVKNIEGNRGKIGKENKWKYRSQYNVIKIEDN